MSKPHNCPGSIMKGCPRHECLYPHCKDETLTFGQQREKCRIDRNQALAAYLKGK